MKNETLDNKFADTLLPFLGEGMFSKIKIGNVTVIQRDDGTYYWDGTSDNIESLVDMNVLHFMASGIKRHAEGTFNITVAHELNIPVVKIVHPSGIQYISQEDVNEVLTPKMIRLSKKILNLEYYDLGKIVRVFEDGEIKLLSQGHFFTKEEVETTLSEQVNYDSFDLVITEYDEYTYSLVKFNGRFKDEHVFYMDEGEYIEQGVYIETDITFKEYDGTNTHKYFMPAILSDTIQASTVGNEDIADILGEYIEGIPTTLYTEEDGSESKVFYPCSRLTTNKEKIAECIGKIEALSSTELA